MTLRSLLAAALLTLLGTAQADPILAGRSATLIPGGPYSWGVATLSPDGTELLLARREAGLTLMDTASARHHTIEGTEGANAALLMPARNRIYAAMMDGSLLILRASDRRILQRLPVDTANLNNLIADPDSGKVLITSGRRAKQSRVYLLDPECDCIHATLDLPAAKLDAPILLDTGRIAIPMRDEGRIAILRVATMTLEHSWQAPQCARPSALAYDGKQQRLFVACRGADPRVLSLDSRSGALLTSAKAGRDINALAYDAAQQRLLAPSGTDARLTLFDAHDSARLQAVASIGTRPWAHNMAYDAQRGIAWLPSMDDTETRNGGDTERYFQADSFTVTRLNFRQPQH